MTAETPPSPSPEEAEGEDEPERQTTPFLVLQFFVFPMAIVAVCVAVFVIFGMVAGESKGATEYLNEVRTGGATRRWQAAFELAKELQAKEGPGALRPEVRGLAHLDLRGGQERRPAGEALPGPRPRPPGRPRGRTGPARRRSPLAGRRGRPRDAHLRHLVAGRPGRSRGGAGPGGARARRRRRPAQERAPLPGCLRHRRGARGPRRGPRGRGGGRALERRPRRWPGRRTLGPRPSSARCSTASTWPT